MSKKKCNFAVRIRTMKNIRVIMYRIYARLRHLVTSWNTGGEGIHSPYLFYLVRFLFYDRNAYYSWAGIEERRRAMLHAPKPLEVTDYGTGRSGTRLLSDIARTALGTPREAQLLYRLALYLSKEARHNEPEHTPLLLELGTSLGLTTAYLAATDSRNRVVTFEGAQQVADIARLNWQKLGLKNIECIIGNLDDTLPRFVEQTLYNNARARADLIFMDANHTYQATLRYYDRLRPLCHSKTIVVVDDIHWSPQMNRAWNELRHRPEVTSSMDLYEMGLLFFDKDYLPKHYRLRL